MKKKKITLGNVKSFLQGKTRKVIDHFNLLPIHIQEQVAFRENKCKKSCPTKCQHCGCETPGRWFSDESCNDGEKFPDLMNNVDWEKYKKKNLRREILYNLIQHIEYYNNLSPFPLWDSGDLNHLKELYKMDKLDYDNETVDCCRFCKNLHILPDEHGNSVCVRCNNIVNNDYETFNNMFDYIDAYGDIWGMKYDKDGREKSNNKDGKETLL